MSSSVRRLLIAHGLSAAAMALPWPALLVAVWESTHDDGLLGAAGAVRLAPYIVLSWLAGRLADRYARGRMVRLSLATRVVALTGVAVALGADQVGAAVALGCLAVALGTPAYPAIAAELPYLTEEAETATGLLVTFEVAAFFVGPALGGLALGWGQPLASCWFAVAATAVSIVLVRGVAWSPIRVEGRHRLATPRPPSVASVLRNDRTSATAVIALAVNNFIGGALAIVLLPLAIDVWQGDTGQFGLATTALGVGALAAPLLMIWWGLASRAGRRSAVVLGGFLVAVAVTPGLWTALVPLAACGAVCVHIEAVATRLIQEAAPEERRSSILGLADSVMVAAAAVGAALAPWAADLLGPRPVVVGCAVAGLAMLGLFSQRELAAVAPAGAAVAPVQAVSLPGG